MEAERQTPVIDIKYLAKRFLVLSKPGKQMEAYTYGRAKQKCRLTDEEILMAQALGISPGWLINNIPSRHEEWKESVASYLYRRFRKCAGKKNPLHATQKQLQMTVPPDKNEQKKLRSILQTQMYGGPDNTDGK